MAVQRSTIGRLVSNSFWCRRRVASAPRREYGGCHLPWLQRTKLQNGRPRCRCPVDPNRVDGQSIGLERGVRPGRGSRTSLGRALITYIAHLDYTCPLSRGHILLGCRTYTYTRGTLRQAPVAAAATDRSLACLVVRTGMLYNLELVYGFGASLQYRCPPQMHLRNTS